MSTPPKAATVPSKRARTEAGSVTSQPTPMAALPMDFATAAAFVSSRSATATCAPRLAKALAVAAPIAPAPPVTITT